MTGQPSDAEAQRAVGRFFTRPDIRDHLDWLDRRLPETAEFYVAGGAPRNAVMAAVLGQAPPTGDIDIFIGGLERGFPLGDLLKDQPTKPTDLKGIRWQPVGSQLAYDLSLLPDFIVIKHYQLEPTLENFMAGIDFSINAIVFDMRRQVLHDAGCTAAVRARTIAFNSRRIPDKVLIAYRILLMAHKTGFCLAEPVFDLVRLLEVEALRHLKGLLRTKVGTCRAAAIMATWDDLGRYHAYEAYRAAHPASVNLAGHRSC